MNLKRLLLAGTVTVSTLVFFYHSYFIKLLLEAPRERFMNGAYDQYFLTSMERLPGDTLNSLVVADLCISAILISVGGSKYLVQFGVKRWMLVTLLTGIWLLWLFAAFLHDINEGIMS